jgi:hypothetical protein
MNEDHEALVKEVCLFKHPAFVLGQKKNSTGYRAENYILVLYPIYNTRETNL